ncbi:MAG: DUF3883 domain-containing protein [Candidatus Thiodiazotropha sp. 'RUGA']|nr:DUF3883 domain-containing protein [Candidatus Thiodiazotropha sp. 'RUGA']
MAQASVLGESSDYTSNLLGNIRSHLQGLQGFDTMALELIQNADDAKAKQIVFDIQEEGLLVWNSGTFTYCGELGKKPCPHQTSEGYSCDFHRISDFGSGGKLSRSENIGRFGIGFSSTYQIADHPEIHSAGIQLTLVPEEGKCYRKPEPRENGTTFYLPWATDPTSPGRQALGVSHVTQDHIQQVVEDCQNVLHESLLFLRNLEKAELRRNGEVLLVVELDRGDDAELIVSFEPKGEVERWFIVRSDAASQTRPVYERYPQLEPLDRKTDVSVAIRVDPEPLEEGLLYAFLPTRQSTGLPFHLNADFFPEDSRKAIIFEGHQHQQAWNELLVRTAASALAEDLVGLRDRLGHTQLWELLSATLVVAQDRKSRYPEPLKSFWEAFKAAVADGAEVGYSEKGEYKPPSDLLLSRKTLSEHELAAFHQIGGELINEALRSHRNALIQLGVKELTLERFVAIADESLISSSAGDDKATPDHQDSFFQPLWAIAEDLLPGTESPSSAVQQSVRQLKRLPFILDTELGVFSIDQCYRAPVGISGENLASSFQYLKFVNDKLVPYPKLYGLVDHFDIGRGAGELEAQLDDGERCLEEVIGNDPETLRSFYSMLGRLDETGEDDEEAYDTLRALPIWRTGNGMSSLEHVLLPGDFEDPTGQAELLDQSCLSASSKVFIERKLQVKRQTIEEYVRTVVPLFFGEDGPEDLDAYRRLILALADHAGLLDNDEIRSLLEVTPLVPASDGGWRRADQLYYRTDELAVLLGEYRSLWVDEKRLPSERSVHVFIVNLGLLDSPITRHLVDRILAVAESYLPDTKARKASETAFYEICNIYDEDSNDKDIEAELNRLVSVRCLPVDGDTGNWYMPEEVYAPFRYQAFQSQAHILDFKNTQKLNSGLLKALSVNTTAETRLVVNHLLHCVDYQAPASNLVYQVLNERARQRDGELSRLRGKPCIYLDAQERYVRPNQLYLIPQNLGKYSFSVPGELDQYKDLFEVIGVKKEPEPKDYIDIVLDIVEENYPRQAQISPEDNAIYQHCMEALAQSWGMDDDISTEDLLRLKQAPTVLSITGVLCHPDEVLLHDSEWHAGHFGDELSPMLCKPDPAWWPFFAELGVERLTRKASVDLEYVDGVEQVEEQIRDKMLERSGVFARMLHDKPVETRRRLVSVFQNISVLSHDEVRIVASVVIADEPVSSEPTSVKAFCDESMEKLVLSRPVGERVWLYIFTVILHRLMPEEQAAHIAQISMNFFQMIGMSVVDAEEFLTEANIPVLGAEGKEGGELDLVSPELGGIGEGEGEGDEADARTGIPSEEGASRSTSLATGTKEGEAAKSFIEGQTDQDVADPAGEQVVTGGRSQAVSGNSQGGVGGTKKKPRRRDPSKKTWDRKLISYVKQRETDERDRESSEVDREYKLSIEVASRAIACAYEKERGRDPEEMAQTHPGYDIVSRQIGHDEIDRYIEVKGTSGEWKNRGVSISRLQFSEAQNHGDKYWLYVVEHALDETCARIHAIQSPAMKVDSYMFDGEWRKVAVDEAADPTLRYKEGKKIDCGLLGVGTIEKVENRGMTKSLLVDFGETKGKKYLALNLKTMTVIEEDDGPDDP